MIHCLLTVFAVVFSVNNTQPLAESLRDIRAKRTGTVERAVVKLASGMYELDETLQLGAADSNLEIVGEPGTVLTRSVVATPGGVVDCEEVAPDAMHFAKVKRILPLFFYDGQWARPARWPNEGFATFSESVDTGVRGEYRSGTAATGKKLPGSFRFKDSRAEKWDFTEGIRIEGYFFYDWAYESLLAKGYDAEKGVLALAVPSTYGIGGPKQSAFFTERRFVVSNVRAELDAPGEYFYDRKTKKVAFVAPEGGVREFRTVNRAGGILAVRAATNVVIRGVAFRYAADTAVTFTACTDVALEDCRISEIGGSGVQISAGNRCTVRGCEIAFLGGGGVSVDGGDRRTLRRGDNVVEGCRIHDYAQIAHVYASGVSVRGCGNVVRGNEIFNAPHAGVIYHGNEQLFESNHVHHVLLESCDAGVFYTGQDATARGNVLRWNLVEDSGIIRSDGRVTGTIAFYLDDCVAGSTIVSNTVRRVPKGVAIGGGHENLVLYNTFEDCPCGVSPDARALSCHKERWDRDWHQTEKLRQMGIDREPWKSRYPLLSQYTPENYPRTPEHCKIVGNVFRRVGSWFSTWEPACKRSMFEIHDNVLAGARFAGSRILFLGDSITEGGKAVYYLQMALDMRLGAKAPTILGCGRSGETAPGGLARWDGEPKAIKADKVFVMYGMNDVAYSDWGEFPPKNSELKRKQDNRIASFEKGMRGLIAKIRDAKAKPVLVTPTPYEEWSTDVKKRPGSNHCNKGLARCAEVVRRLGVELECEVVDLHAEMTRILSAHPSEKFNPDNIHPGFAGADLMAMLFLEQAGIRPEFSRVEFDATGAKSFVAEYKPTALPLPVDDAYRQADRCANLTSRINRETLVVRNLAPGRYALKANGTRLASFTTAELAAGVNLATLETPNQVRARELLAVNRKLIDHCSEMRVLNQVIGWSKQGGNWNLDDAAQRKDFVEKKRKWVNATGWAGWGNHMLNVFERQYDQRDQLAKTEVGYRAALKDCAPKGWKLELVREDSARMAEGVGTWRLPPETVTNGYCTVTAGGMALDVFALPCPPKLFPFQRESDLRPYGAVFFEAEGETEVVGTFADGKRFSFKAKPPFTRVVEDDGRHGALVVCANLPERDVPDRNDPKVKWFGPGVHRLDEVRLVSGETLYLAPGAVVEAPIIAEGKDIVVRGRGILSGIPWAWTKGPSKYCWTFRGERLSIRDVSFAGAWYWAVVLDMAKDVTVDGIRILGGKVLNDDGIDVCRSEDVTIRNAFIRTQDDCIAPKWWCRNLLVENCTLWTDYANIVRLGWECDPQGGPFENIVFRNLDVRHLSMEKRPASHAWFNSAFCLQASNGQTIRNVFFDRVDFANVEAGDIQFVAYTGTCGPYRGGGRIDRIRLRDFTVPANAAPMITRYAANAPGEIGLVTLDHVAGRKPPELVNDDGPTEATAGRCAFADGKGLFNRRLGMFVHWGVYSVGGFHEQDMWMKGKTRAEYGEYLKGFTAENFDADRFVDVAESAGAEYIVITAKHHDGFCLWDTATTDYCAMKSPAKRDLIGELAAACHRRGMGLGFYYSNPDWHCPFSNNPKSTHQLKLQPGDQPDLERYAAYEKAQIRELLTKYGEICCWFWDIPTGVPRPEMDALVRALQPKILINDRGWEKGYRIGGDYRTPERDFSRGGNFTNLVEACNSVGKQSWGYRSNEDYHTVGSLVRGIDGFLACGGNYLLNVGPRADGTIPAESVKRMASVGGWLARVRESFEDVQCLPQLVKPIRNSPFTWIKDHDEPVDFLLTRRGDTLYVHYPRGLNETGVDLAPLAVKPLKATLLNTGEALKSAVELMPCNRFMFDRESLHIWGIPADGLVNECVVLKLEFAPGALIVESSSLQ